MRLVTRGYVSAWHETLINAGKEAREMQEVGRFFLFCARNCFLALYPFCFMYVRCERKKVLTLWVGVVLCWYSSCTRAEPS